MRRVEQYLLGSIVLMAAWAIFLVLSFQSCSWDQPGSELRMLLIGDPQIEGNADWQNKSTLNRVIVALNDEYMKYIVDSLVVRLKPTHVVVMGDLFSYQGTTDAEFDERLSRYNRIFGKAMNHSIIVNVTGNHDLGYGHEISTQRKTRFEKAFGATNFHFHHTLREDLNNDTYPDMAVVSVINNLLMDPSLEQPMRHEIWEFTGDLASIRSLHPREPFILVAHVPLHKQIGCVDKPLIVTNAQGHITKQNHLSVASTSHLLDFLQPDVILTGHDHHGCNYNHTNARGKHIPEYTIRSIMGDYSGTGALLEFHTRNGSWVHTFKYCHFAPFRLLTTSVVLFLSLVLVTSLYFIIKCACR